MLKVQRAAHVAQLIVKLQSWGYDSNAVKPVAKVVEKLDSAALSLVERLAGDLTQLGENSRDLKVQVSTLSDDLDHEKQLLERLRVENQRLLKANSELRAQVERKGSAGAIGDGITSPSDILGDEQIQQWRAQSMHQLQELELMNQALRSTLNRQTSGLPTGGTQSGGQGQVGGYISLSEPLAPLEPISPPAPKTKLKAGGNQKLELVRVVEMRCKKMEEELENLKERHSALQGTLSFAQEQIAAKDRELQQFQASAKKISPVDSKEVTSISKKIPALTSQLDSLAVELLALQEVYEKEKEAQKSVSLPRPPLGSSTKKIEMAGRHHIEHLLQDCDGEQKLSSIKSYIQNLDQKEEELVDEIHGLKSELETLCAERIELRCMVDELCKEFPSGIIALATLQEKETIRQAGSLNVIADRSAPEFNQSLTKTLFLINEKEALQRSLCKVQELKTELEGLQTAIVEQEAAIVSLHTELFKKTDQLAFITDEKVVGEEALEASQLECSQLASLIREIDGSMAQLTSALATRTLERDQETEVRMTVEEQLCMKCNNLVEEVESLQLRNSQLQADHAGCGHQREESNFKLMEAASQLKQCMRRAETAERDVEQLKALITQLDSTREELVGKLKSTLGNQQMVEEHAAAMDMEVQRLSKDCDARIAEVGHLCGLLESLGKDRNNVQAEVNLQGEKILQLSEENGQLQTEIHYMKCNLQNAEHRLQEGHSLIQQAESEIASLKGQLSAEEDIRKNLEVRYATKTSELHSAEEMISTLSCELRMVKSELVQLVSEHENAITDLHNTNSKLHYAEQMLHVKEKEEEEIMKLYHSLCEDNQHLKLAALEGDNQLQNQQYQIQSLEEAVQRAQAQIKLAAEENRQLASDLKAAERQGDLMSRSLSQQSALITDHQSEKAALLSQISGLKTASTELELRNANVLGELAALETKHQYVADHLQECQQEREALTTRYRLERERIRELEQLLACVRAHEHQLELESKDTGSKYTMMRDRLFCLEEQVQTLRMTRDAQNQEIMRLQSCLPRETEERTRCHPLALSPPLSNHSMEIQLHQTVADVAGSKAKIQELEMKNFSLSGDLLKTASLYKDCFACLQKVEAQNMDMKREYEHALSLLSKVDEDRTQLQRKCLELVAAADQTHQQKLCTASHRVNADPPSEDIEALQKVCHQLKQETTPASSECSRVNNSHQ
ncbi:unnamed protein product [Sphagnum jensenii]|uniref:Uncharacterized protein n=1 Tax=Sphagnum jensenii TaxID=128206 RepID=A0ABP1ALR7_9BRYO